MRRRRSKRLAPVKSDGIVPANLPKCCTCGKPLLRLPPSLASATRRPVFQCADCFYPGTGRAAQQSAPLASARNHWLAEFPLDTSE